MMSAQVYSPAPAEATTVPLPMRAHTILGVCEAIGEDFGFNPNWIRIPLASTVIFSPLFSFTTYFALGAVVLASRLIAPTRDTGPADYDSAVTAPQSASVTVEEKLAA